MPLNTERRSYTSKRFVILKMLKILIMILGIISLNTYATETEKTFYGEQSFDNLPTGYVLTINDFARLGKIIPIPVMNEICKMNNKPSNYSSYIKDLEYVLKEYDVDLESFKRIGFVNLNCSTGNFAYEIMENSITLFQMLIDYKLDFNRPIVVNKKVGTFLDFSLLRIKNLRGSDAVTLGTSIQKLKAKGFKTCAQQGIRCSFDQP